jgi:hypothetical protein
MLGDDYWHLRVRMAPGDFRPSLPSCGCLVCVAVLYVPRAPHPLPSLWPVVVIWHMRIGDLLHTQTFMGVLLQRKPPRLASAPRGLSVYNANGKYFLHVISYNPERMSCVRPLTDPVPPETGAVRLCSPAVLLRRQSHPPRDHCRRDARLPMFQPQDLSTLTTLGVTAAVSGTRMKMKLLWIA